jgi:hypothetical protein
MNWKPTIFTLFVFISSFAFPLSADQAATELFEKRILPIFNSPNPSSCTECHLAGVDLKNYILPSHEKTFVSLRDLGLIDLDNPNDSKILKLITMGAESSEGAALISKEIQTKEYEAFREWIKASVADVRLRNLPPLKEEDRARPPAANGIIRHARFDRVLSSFEKNIWSQRMRCQGCHLPGSPENTKHVEEYGEDVSWMSPSAERTMRNLIESENINIGAPERSRLLLKPLNEIKHGGGQKMLVGDMSYKAFRTWIEDYARLKTNGYSRVQDLPQERIQPLLFGSKIWLKVENTPSAWDDRLLQVLIFAWDLKKEAWEQEPVAKSDRAVWGKGKLWQHELVLLAPAGSERAVQFGKEPQLAAGRYLVEVFVDQKEKLKSNWQSELGSQEKTGKIEVTTSWPTGYGKMTKIDATKILPSM